MEPPYKSKIRNRKPREDAAVLTASVAKEHSAVNIDNNNSLYDEGNAQARPDLYHVPPFAHQLAFMGPAMNHAVIGRDGTRGGTDAATAGWDGVGRRDDGCNRTWWCLWDGMSDGAVPRRRRQRCDSGQKRRHDRCVCLCIVECTTERGRETTGWRREGRQQSEGMRRREGSLWAVLQNGGLVVATVPKANNSATQRQCAWTSFRSACLFMRPHR